MVPGESRLYDQRYLRRPFAVRAYRAHWWQVIHVGELASYTLAHVSFNAGRLCRDGHGFSFNGADLCTAPQQLPHRDPATRSLDHHDVAAMGRRSGDNAGARVMPVSLPLGLALAAVWGECVGEGGEGHGRGRYGR